MFAPNPCSDTSRVTQAPVELYSHGINLAIAILYSEIAGRFTTVMGIQLRFARAKRNHGVDVCK